MQSAKIYTVEDLEKYLADHRTSLTAFLTPRTEVVLNLNGQIKDVELVMASDGRLHILAAS
jgi:hypothetical protein